MGGAPRTRLEGRVKKGGQVTRLFIANRGEIARRIALTSRRLGISTVALTDRQRPNSYLLDAVSTLAKVDEESPALYLNIERMLELAKASGADSVHPGFGFLSENSDFAAACLKSGLTWVGPNPAAIEAMASKAKARAYAEKAGVPCVRGLAGFPVPQNEAGDFSALEAFAKAAGYPLLMKAAYGGGGKGMRVVERPDELKSAALRAASEAKHSFGNDALICEQYLTAPRHIEVQILADQLGTVVAVGDRDCSLQRRHQKIIEEAPAPALSPKTRQALHQAAINLAAAVGYDSTGTVEFLLDWSPDSRGQDEQRFFFLEMNTRLQVEHPVSEEVFGLDLVEWQIRVARGESLPEHFGRLEPRGHSIEARIYAENTRDGFFPAPGPVAAFDPALGPGLRWEIGLDPVDEITGRFDPMIAKLVATADSRAGALTRLDDALARTVLAGPPNNIDLLRELVTASVFANEPVTTHFIGQELANLLDGIDRRLQDRAELAEQVMELLAFGLGAAPAENHSIEALTQSIFQAKSGPKAAKTPPKSAFGQPSVEITATSHLMGGERGHLTSSLARGVAHRDAVAIPFWYACLAGAHARQFWVSLAGDVFTRRVEAKRSRASGPSGSTLEVTAPVPGKVIQVKVEAGQEIQEGQTIMVLESMKMEFEVKAGKSGKLAAISVQAGEQVTASQQLATWDA